MKIAITTIGTTGDIAPFLRLVDALVARDHHVVLCSHERYRQRGEAHGATFVAAGPQVDDAKVHEIGQSAAKAKDIFAQLGILRDFFLTDAEADYHQLKATFADVDVVICHAIHNVAQAAAFDAGKPWLRVQLEPSSIPTAHAAPPPLPSMGKGLNRWLWRQVEAQLAKLDAPLHQLFDKVGSKSDAHRLFRAESPDLNLVACSRHIAAFYDDLPKHYRVTGAWLATPEPTDPPEALATFLQEHPRPLVFSFGSMAGEDAATTHQVIREAIAALGQPAVIQRGAAGFEASSEPADGIFYAGFVPHTYLFPQASCVIHHGGAGTLATACAAGAPSLVVPHLGDQFYWGQRVYKVGIGAKPLPIKKLTARRLAARIAQTLAPSCAAHASKLSADMAQEGGISDAVDAIEAFATSLPK